MSADESSKARRSGDAPARSDDAKDAPRDRSAAATEAELDKALKDTFPASDPVPPRHTTGAEDEPGSRIDRKPPALDEELVDELARDVRRKAGGGT